ncbi:resuscitation-promoting factor Rpf [Micrococcus porci]|uniref:resuscitation-promoting factor Rpf n=1 Tax=Micrococcus porci TaxID=2856555 RepID=UPI003CEAD746
MTFFTTSTRRATATALTGMTLVGGAAAFAAPAQAASVESWDKIAACESNGNWAINTGNGYYGGLQFSVTSWRGVGGTGYPHQASKAEQIKRAEILQDMQGWRAWPVCSVKAGLSGADTAPDAYSTTPVQRQSTQASDSAAQDWAAEQSAAEQRAAEKAAAQRAAAAAHTPKSVLKAAEKANTENATELAAAEDTVFVKPGDSLWKIAKTHKVAGGWKALHEANKDIIEDASMIYVGQELVLPTA